ncbi:hypothetical protein [Synechococcus elongatus]|uniref:hypothetical protein n=1 Tax=Synechococcus elongatus TaxID=32046 RepID=UPI000F7DD16C|nr:hypothetical protein [Synechococcus elongatus]
MIEQTLLSDKETARALRISIKKLANICRKFDENPDDEWELNEGEHFEWIIRHKQRYFYEQGAVAIAKYLEVTEGNNIIDKLIEFVTHRRKAIRRALVLRKISQEAKSELAVVSSNTLFLHRKSTIRILETNGKGVNSAISRIQSDNSYEGAEIMAKGRDFDEFENEQYFSKYGILKLAKDMQVSIRSKSRQAWLEAVIEEIEPGLDTQYKKLISRNQAIKKAIAAAKRAAYHRCQVTGEECGEGAKFDLHGHHLFSKESRDDLATNLDNILVIKEEVHDAYHKWHSINYSGQPCTPASFIEYLQMFHAGMLDNPKSKKRFLDLIERLENLQNNFGR